jgi:hypothetical protein
MEEENLPPENTPQESPMGNGEHALMQLHQALGSQVPIDDFVGVLVNFFSQMQVEANRPIAGLIALAAKEQTGTITEPELRLLSSAREGIAGDFAELAETGDFNDTAENELENARHVVELANAYLEPKEEYAELEEALPLMAAITDEELLAAMEEEKIVEDDLKEILRLKYRMIEPQLSGKEKRKKRSEVETKREKEARETQEYLKVRSTRGSEEKKPEEEDKNKSFNERRKGLTNKYAEKFGVK